MMKTRAVIGQIWYTLLHSVISYLGMESGLGYWTDIFLEADRMSLGFLDFSYGSDWVHRTYREHLIGKHYGRGFMWHKTPMP